MRWNALEQLELYVCNARAVHSLPLPQPPGSVPIDRPAQACGTGDPAVIKLGSSQSGKPVGRNLDNLATRPRLCVGDSRERRVAGSNVLDTIGVSNLDNRIIVCVVGKP
jgi:hypothetical protein